MSRFVFVTDAPDQRHPISLNQNEASVETNRWVDRNLLRFEEPTMIFESAEGSDSFMDPDSSLLRIQLSDVSLSFQ